VFVGYVFFFEPVAHGVSAEVHVGGGFEEEYFSPFVGCLCDVSVSFILKNGFGCFCEGIQNHVSSVVPGVGVLCAWVSESGDKVFFQCFLFILLLLLLRRLLRMLLRRVLRGSS